MLRPLNRCEPLANACRYPSCIVLRVRISGAGFFFTAALLLSSCGSASAPVPTAPSSSDGAPGSLVGMWRGSAQSKAQRLGSDTAVGFALNCAQRWQIVSQSGAHFEGQMSSQGTSPESDWRCTETRSFSGQVSSDAVAIDFSPGFSPGGCTDVVGGEHATGSIADGSIVVSLPYRATCQMAPSSGAPSWDLDITTTVTLTPW